MKSGRHMGGKAPHMKFKSGGAAGGDDVDEPSPKDVYAGGDSEVRKEAEEKAKGGAVKKRARGGRMEMHGEHEKAKGRRMDRPGRKRGGGVGADMHPLSTAARTKDAEGHSTGSSGETGLDEDD